MLYFILRNRKSITETRSTNRKFYAVALCVGVWNICLFFNQFWIFFLYIPDTIIFIVNDFMMQRIKMEPTIQKFFLILLKFYVRFFFFLRFIISLKINLFSPWYTLCIAALVLSNKHSLTLLAIPCEMSCIHFQTLNVSEIKMVKGR